MGKPIPIDRVRENIPDRDLADDDRETFTRHQAERERRGVHDRPGAQPREDGTPEEEPSS